MIAPTSNSAERRQRCTTTIRSRRAQPRYVLNTAALRNVIVMSFLMTLALGYEETEDGKFGLVQEFKLQTKKSGLKAGIMTLGLGGTSTITVRYHPGKAERNNSCNICHRYEKVNGTFKPNEWFSMSEILDHDKVNKRINVQMHGIKNRWIYYSEYDGPRFIEHMRTACGLYDQTTDVRVLFAAGGHKFNHLSDGRVNFNMHDSIPYTRRRLAEAAYYSFIGFNMLLMCCLLVGISFAYHVGTHEANRGPVRW